MERTRENGRKKSEEEEEGEVAKVRVHVLGKYIYVTLFCDFPVAVDGNRKGEWKKGG